MKTFAIAALGGISAASAYTPLPDYVKSLPYANGAYDCSTCSASVKAQLEDKDFRSDKKEGWHDNAGWTPWVNRDEPTGTGDHETYEALNQKHNLCGVNNNLGGFFGPLKAECVTGNGLTAAQAGQTATCDKSGFTCLNADNQKCFGTDAKCAAANKAQGNNRNGISNAEDQCREHAAAHGCHWGCYDYSVRFKCERSWTKAPSPSPTPLPTMAPTYAPTTAPTPAPTPAPSPRGLVESKEAHAAGKPGGLMASKGIEFHPQFSLINNGGFTDGTTSWRANLEGTVMQAHEDRGKHWLTVKSSQLGDTPGVFQYLDIPGKDTLNAGQHYLVSIKGKGSSTQWSEKWNAKPFVECNVGGTRQQMLSVNAEPLPPSDGTCIARFKPTATATECRAGVLFFGTKPTSEMTLEQFEVRPMFAHEEVVLNEDLSDRSHGIIANHNFAHGSQFWGRINARDEVWSNGKDLVVWNHGKPAGQHTGVQQTGLTLKAGERYRFALKGRVDRNGEQFGNAVLFVSKTTRDSHGNSKTVDITSSVGLQGLKQRLSAQGTTTRFVDFTASAEDKSLAQVTYNVGARFEGLTPSGVEMFLEDSKLDIAPKNTAEETRLTNAEEAAYHAELAAKRVARNTKACNCSPRVHSSKATKCFAEQSGFSQRTNVIRVVHRKSMLAPETFENIGADQADSHKCEMVDNACKCCDCKDGQTHGFDLASLKDGRKFTVRFDRSFANGAGNVKPGMTGTCRYFEGKWCCACTNSYLGAKGDKTENRCPYTYGQEFCNAYSGTSNPEGINFWGRNYHFKEYHRCVTPSMHHNCGEGVKADGSLKQDIGHLPFFDNNAVNQGDGFAIVNNAQELISTLGTYDKTTDNMSVCASTGTPQVGGLQGNQVLSADTCAALCDNDVSCKAFNYHVSTGTSDTKCDFITQVGAGCLKGAANVFFYQKKPVANQL